jgi:AcrR family transcriptional regulator
MTNKTSSLTASQRGRPREFDIDAALDGAIAVFTQKGFHGVSVSDLAAAMKVSAGSLYKAFPDKQAIFMAALNRYIALRQQEMAQKTTGFATGYDEIAAILQVYAELASGKVGQLGCLVVASNVELASNDENIARRIEGQLSSYEKRFVDLIIKGQNDGSVRKDIAPASTATMLLCLIQGMRVVGKVGYSLAAMQQMISQALKMLV